MNSRLSVLELIFAIVCFFNSIWNWLILREKISQRPPTGGSMVMFLVGLMLGLAAFLDGWSHHILLSGIIALGVFGFTASTASIAWFDRHDRAVLAVIGTLVVSVAVGLVYDVGHQASYLPTLLLLITAAGLYCPLLWKLIHAKPASNDVAAIQAPPPVTKV